MTSIQRDVSDSGLMLPATSVPLDSFLNQVFDTIPSVVYVYNVASAENEYSSGGLTRFLGYTPEELQAMGTSFMAELCHPEDLPRFAEYVALLSTIEKDELRKFEYRMRHKDGRWIWFLSNDTVLETSPTGEIERLL